MESPDIFIYDGRECDLNKNLDLVWQRKNKDGTVRKVKPFLTLVRYSKVSRFKGMVNALKEENNDATSVGILIGPSLIIPALEILFDKTSHCRKVKCYLPPRQKRAVRKYVTGGPLWNEQLREGMQLDEKRHDHVIRLTRALNALPIVSVLKNQLPEGLIGEGIRDVMSFYVDQMPKLLFRADNCTPDRIQEFRKIMEEGSLWSDKGFLSTSLVEIWELKFHSCNTHITIVNPKTGKLIEEVGNKKETGKGEHEVLFNRNTPFRVLRVEEDKDKEHNCAGKYCIILEENAEWPQF